LLLFITTVNLFKPDFGVSHLHVPFLTHNDNNHLHCRFFLDCTFIYRALTVPPAAAHDESGSKPEGLELLAAGKGLRLRGDGDEHCQ
jgi:hypothetical protein